MNLNPICHPLQPKKWNAHFWITFNFWWLAGLVDGLKPQPPPLFSQKMKSSFLDYIQLLMIGQAGQWTRTPSATPLQPKNEMLIFGLHSLWMIGQAGQWTQTPSTTPLQPIKWNASFWIMFTTDDQPGWSMDSKPHLPPLSIQKKWNAHFWIMFNFWWLAGLVDGLEPHPPPLSTQKNEMLIFGLCSTSDDWLSCSIDLNPIHHPSPPKNMKCLSLYNIQHLMLARLVKGLKPHLPPSLAKKWNVHFWIMFNFWWLAGLVDALKPHLPPLSSPKNEMLIFGLCSTSDNWNGWSMDSNPIHHPSPTNKMKCSVLEYVQLLMISLAGQWTRTPSASPLQPKKWNATFWITFNLWWSAWLVDGLEPHLPALSSQKNEMLLFGLRSTSDDWLG